MTNCLPKIATGLQFFARGRCFFYGLLLPLAFAPFHIPGFAVISLGLFFHELNKHCADSPVFSGFKHGMLYGLGFFGLGTSWVYVSIHNYGHLTALLSALITLLFILYLSLFSAGVGGLFQYLRLRPYSVFSVFAFAALWTLSEYLRATVLTGFPWLLIGHGQLDAPTKNLLPLVGVYGVTLITCMASGTFILIFKQPRPQRIWSVLFFLLMLLSPTLFYQKEDNAAQAQPISIGVVQSNISMRDKWNEQLFWQLLQQHQENIRQLLGTKLIVLPEAAIPLPASYIQDILDQLSNEARLAGSAILLGIPEKTGPDGSTFYNTLMALGQAKGNYLKQHLVPFGEYNPKPFRLITEKLDLPDPNMLPGHQNQKPIKIHHIPIATLICYELAYGHLLRAQLPHAQLIVSISDDGWFGHSLAMYQHLQMAQVQSLQTRRYQVVANNDGLSSVINSDGKLIASLPPFKSGILKTTLIPKTIVTPWVKLGDFPALFCVGIINLLCLGLRLRKMSSHTPLLPLNSREAILTGLSKNNK